MFLVLVFLWHFCWVQSFNQSFFFILVCISHHFLLPFNPKVALFVVTFLVLSFSPRNLSWKNSSYQLIVRFSFFNLDGTSYSEMFRIMSQHQRAGPARRERPTWAGQPSPLISLPPAAPFSARSLTLGPSLRARGLSSSTTGLLSHDRAAALLLLRLLVLGRARRAAQRDVLRLPRVA